MNVNKLMSIQNFAKAKKISRQWIYILIKKGEIKPIKIDGRNYLPSNTEIVRRGTTNKQQ